MIFKHLKETRQKVLKVVLSQATAEESRGCFKSTLGFGGQILFTRISGPYGLLILAIDLITPLKGVITHGQKHCFIYINISY